MRQFFTKGVWAITAAFLSSQAVANGLGQRPPEWWPRSYFGENAQISDLGEMRFDWIDPVSNNYKVVSFQQTSVISVPKEIQQFVAGNQVSCISILQTDGLDYADCYVFLDDLEQGVTSILRLISASDGDLIDCSPNERRAFASAGVKGCGS